MLKKSILFGLIFANVKGVRGRGNNQKNCRIKRFLTEPNY